ncbi:ATP-binding protein [Horticoccus sp. 23ND18S-11]|uniref:ATP-binding protein n=1 Tax=Horticoccus sp. 23ND18S-11 TaxID=3391832 RepID=UPI0039C8F507
MRALLSPSLRSLRQGALAILAGLAISARSATFDPEAGLPVIRNFLPETYRGHSQIFASARAPDGIMYFGTYGQVVSFDGERWRQHPVSGTWTRALTFGSDGLLYIGGGGLLGRLEADATGGGLRFVSLVDRLPAEQRGFATVWNAVTAGDAVLFAIDGATLTWRNGGFRVQPFPGQRPAVRSAANTVFCHAGDQLLRWDGQDWQPFARNAALAAARRITLLSGEAGGWVIALDAGGLLRLGADGTIAPWPTAAAEFLLRAGIRNGVRLADGSYALSTAGEGVVILSHEGTPLRRLGAESGLAHAATYGLAHGADGALWVETANGLSTFEPLAPWSVFDVRNGRPDTIGGEPSRFKGELIITMSDVAPLRLRPAPDPLGAARLEPYGNTRAARLSNMVPMHGGLLSGNERGVVRADGDRQVLHASPSQVEDMRALQQLPGVLVIGMLRGVELVRVAPDFTVTSLGRVPDFELETTNIREAAGRTVWIGTTSGIALRLRLGADGTPGEATRFDTARGLPAGTGWVKVHRTPEGPLLCVRDGVFRLDATGERLVPDQRFSRQRPSGVNTLPIEGDDAGRFWFQIPGGESGFQMGCLDTRGGETSWTLLPPAISNSLGYGGARDISYLRENGRELLWISGVRSTVRIDLSSAPNAAVAPSVVISAIVQGSTHGQPRATTLQLPYRREPLRLQFASPEAALAPVSYETRLLGYAEDWTPATAPEATFTNLIGGPFTLEVRARDALGRTGSVARTTFAVSPPWHRTPAAYAAYGLGLFGAVAGFVRWRLTRAEHERRRLEGIVADRTRDLAAARDQAEAASRAKSAFLAAMSHELRTPLNGVIGYAQILQADPRLVSDQRDRVRIVHQSGEHLLRMINDVLDLAKIEAGKLELRPAPFPPRDLIQDVTAAHAPAAHAKRLAFHTEIAPGLAPWVEGDAQKLRQVLDNLLGNAVKFTERGSVRLSVTASDEGEPATPRLVFTVTDTGPGISAADQARLFQPFEQAHDTRSAMPGTGLGLAISRAIVERMGGTLDVTSTPGTGSSFACTVALPACAAPVHAVARPTVTGYDGPRRRVLIVDDHTVNRSLLTDLLAPLGFTCSEASSGEEALARLTTGTEAWPELAIVDLRMDGIDGLELTRRIRALPRGQAVKVILTSASVISFRPEDGRAAGCDDFLPKPFRTADLVEKIGALLALRWHEVAAAPTSIPAVPSDGTPLPAPAAAALRDLLASGDLEAFRAALARERLAHPAAEAQWQAMDEAAATFQLSRLRQLLA